MPWPVKPDTVVESVVFNGRKFNRYPESPHAPLRKYFWRGGGGGVSLHRAVWEFHNGPIPEGWHVHHKDGNVDNNDIENLECLPADEHAAKHSEERSAHASRPEQLEHLARIRPKATEWHRSEEGKKWHAEVTAKHLQVGGKAWKANKERREREKANPIPRNCAECGAEFLSATGRAQLCSNACACRRSARKKRERARLQSERG